MSTREQGRLVADAVTVERGDVRVLDRVTLTVEPGALTAVTGPSGAGKTTLVWVLAGALSPTSGTVTLGGRPVTDRVDAAADGIAMIAQGNALSTPLTAFENVLVAVQATGTAPADAARAARSALELVGLDGATHHLVEELSGGQQQRVAIARAIAVRPAVVLADEPTSDLDGTTREVVVSAFAELAAGGTGVLMVTHDQWCADRADVEHHLAEGHLTTLR